MYKRIYLGIGLIVASIALIPLSIMEFIDKGKARGKFSFAAPASQEVEVKTSGRYVLWHDHYTRWEGQTVSHPEFLPGGWSFCLTSLDDPSQRYLLTPGSRTTVESPSKKSRSVGHFDVEKEGRYQLSTGPELAEQSAATPNESRRILTFSKSRVHDILYLVLYLAAVAPFCFFSGLGLLIWGWVARLRETKQAVA